MKILSRYLAREFTQNFLLGLGAFCTLYLVVDFFERINSFISHRAAWSLIGAYFLNKFPAILFQVTPAAVLLAAIITLGTMSRHNEIMALKSGGIGLWSLVHPLLGAVLLIFVGLLGLNEFVVPTTNQNARMIRDMDIRKKKPVAAFKQSQVWIRSPHQIFNIQLIRPETNTLEGLTLYRFNSNFEVVQRVDARSARWKEGQWVLTDASVTDFTPEGMAQRKNHREFVLSIPETPADLQIAERNPDEMNFRELRSYVEKIERDGYDASKYRTAMHAAISFPFTTVIMVFLGIPLAVRKERGEGLARGIAYSILISFGYLVVYSFVLEIGKGGNLPPFLAAWLGNFIFAIVGVYLLLSVRQ